MADSISQMDPATDAQVLLPLRGGLTADFPIADLATVSNKRVTPYQFGQSQALTFISDAVNLKVAAGNTLTVPAGYLFYVEECVVIATDVGALVAQPVVSFGVGGDLTRYVNAQQMTLLTSSNTRERVRVEGIGGESNLVATVDTGASAGTFEGRFCWRGQLISTSL